MKLGILLSGRGSNMLAIAQSIVTGALSASIEIVMSDDPLAPGLEKARSMGLTSLALDFHAVETKDLYDDSVLRALQAVSVDCVVLAGYMRLLGPVLLTAYSDRILNIHPSLLPSFKGLYPQRQALASDHRESGCTVHLVTEDLDGGPILGQRSVPILAGDSELDLSERILVEEHKLYSDVLQQIVLGRIQIGSNRSI